MVNAYAFELSKCWDQVVRERQLLSLANIHPDLCQRVADSLGLPAPEPTQPPAGTSTSAALTQLGQTWPVAGRQVGIVVGADVDAGAVATLRAAFDAAGVVPLVVGPHGGAISMVTMQRSYAVAASIEFDALVVTGPVPPAPDARPSVDVKAEATASAGDPRVVKLLGEAWRLAKAIGALDGADEVLAAAGVPGDGAGVVRGTRQAWPRRCSSCWASTARGTGSRPSPQPDLTLTARYRQVASDNNRTARAPTSERGFQRTLRSRGTATRPGSASTTRHANTARSGSMRCPVTGNSRSSSRQNVVRSGPKAASTMSGLLGKVVRELPCWEDLDPHPGSEAPQQPAFAVRPVAWERVTRWAAHYVPCKEPVITNLSATSRRRVFVF